MTIDDADKEALTGQQIRDDAPDGWSYNLSKLIARFETGDFNTGAALVTKIAEAADEMNHHPDVDLRYPHLTVSLMSHDVDAVTRRDLRLARTISDLAADAGANPSTTGPDVLEYAIDTPDHGKITPFWAAILGWEAEGDQVSDPSSRNPNIWFQSTDSDAPDRQRWHIDISVAHEVAEKRIQAAIDAGGTLVDDGAAPSFWVLADPDGNKACICTWQGRD